MSPPRPARHPRPLETWRRGAVPASIAIDASLDASGIDVVPASARTIPASAVAPASLAVVPASVPPHVEPVGVPG